MPLRLGRGHARRLHVPGTARPQEARVTTCNLCGELMETVYVLDHLRLAHPDDYEPPAEWPDGSPVIVDQTLTPEDFR